MMVLGVNGKCSDARGPRGSHSLGTENSPRNSKQITGLHELAVPNPKGPSTKT